MSNESFLPEGYEKPRGNGNYFKLQDGENKFRVLGKPIIGWLDWKDNKPLRFTMDSKPSAPIDPKKKIKHFWAFPVWDYVSKSIAIFEISQGSIQDAITGLSRDADWGAPFGYDIKITKAGAGLDTTYTVNPVPHKPLHPQIAELFAKTPMKLEALFEGKDPFDVEKKVEETSDLPWEKEEVVEDNEPPF